MQELMNHIDNLDEQITELVEENINLKNKLSQVAAERDNWKYEAKCEHDHAVGFMRECDDWKMFADGRGFPCEICKYINEAGCRCVNYGECKTRFKWRGVQKEEAK